MRRFVSRMTVLFAVTLPLYTQEYRATIAGQVTDPTGASVPGARVSATNLGTGVKVNSEANAQGRFVIPYLLPGQYKVRVEQDGFRSFERSPIELRIADRAEVNAQLEVGQV